MVQPEIGYPILIGACFLLSILTAAMEESILGVSSARLKQLAEEGKSGIELLQSAGKESVLQGLKFWNLLLTGAAGFFAASQGCVATASPCRWMAPVYALLIILLCVICQLAVRQMVVYSGEKVAVSSARAAVWLKVLAAPLTFLSLLLSSPLRRTRGLHESRPVTEDDIKMMVDVGQEHGVLEEEESEMIHSIIQMGDTIAREIMVPRIDMICIQAQASQGDVLELAILHGLSKIPVYEETIDNIVGIAYIRDILPLLKENRLQDPVQSIIRPALFVPGTKKVDDLLGEMRKAKISMAIIVDEYGGTDGLLTTEDILEEIVGDLADEHDREGPPLQIQEDGTAIVDAKMNIEDLNSQLDLRLPDDEYESLGGLVYGFLGRVPARGDEVTVEDVVIRVEKILRQRITLVRILKQGAHPGFGSRDSVP
ncbi:MAG: hemolysin family protein [bacterium]